MTLDIFDHSFQEMGSIILVLRDIELGEKRKCVIESRDLRPSKVKALKEGIDAFIWSEFLCNVIPPNDCDTDVIPQNVIVNDMFNRFRTKIQDMINEHVPINTRTTNE